MDLVIWISLAVILIVFSIANIVFGKKGREVVSILGLIWLLLLLLLRQLL